MSQVSGSALESSQVSNETSTQDREMESVEGIKTRPVPHLEAETLPGDPVPQNLWDPNLPVLDQDSRTNPGPYSSTLPAQSSSAPEDDSRYPEVRTSVHSTDISDPTSTPRAWALGLIFSVLLPGVNQFFFYRYPSVQVQGIVAQLLAHPLGLALGRLPWRGEWNPKEHTLVYIMANVSAGTAYATNLIAVQRFFYGQEWGWGYQFLLVMSTQLLGFSFAGYLHRFLVRPASMIWPSTLVNTALFNTLHPRSGPSEARTSCKARQTFFYVQAIGMFAWSFLPAYLFTALSAFDWVTWIKPNNQVVNLLFGYQSGAGLSLLTFDWGMVASFANPLATPWWTTANILGGFVFFVWILAPGLYYSNVFFAKYLPFSSAHIFDNAAESYKNTRILTSEKTLDVLAYEAYSPVYMPISFALSYGLNFAAVTATIVHCILFFRHFIWSRARPSAKTKHDADDDVHTRLMARYRPVPSSWYALLFLLTIGMSIAAIRASPTELPVWALFVATGVAGVLVLPVGLIQAMTNWGVGINVVTEMIVGFAVPEKPVAMMIFKTYGYISTTQALGFVQDQKLAHYMHLPPRTVFFGQLVGGAVGSITQLLVQDWLFKHVDGICDASSLTWWCPSTRTFLSSSVIFGLLGPHRLFSPGSLYSPLLWFFPLGAVLPIITWFLARRWPMSGWKYVCWPVVFSCVSLLPPYLPINFISFCMAGWVFQYYVRRKRPAWWSRYNYVLSAAWTCGYALCAIVIFFCLQLPKNGQIGEGVQSWWGNTVYTNTLDGQGGSAAAALHLEPGETFGLATGKWS